MTDNLLRRLEGAFPLTEQDCGEYKTMKISGMQFRIRSFTAQGLGHVSVMSASGFLGLMKMDTLIVNPFEKDSPLFSYDRICAMGNQTLCLELFDTMLERGALPRLAAVKEGAARYPDHQPKSAWYDPLILPQSIFKKGKKKDAPAYDSIVEDFMAAFVEEAKLAAAADPDAKREKAKAYSEGLLTHGGPATDVFKKALGEEKTGDIFRRILFGTN